MKTLDYTHLDASSAKKTIDALKQLLADYQIFYTNLRGLHWNIKGKKFFHLHEKFEEMYDDTAAKVDEVAERILMLGGVPAHNFSEYLKISTFKESGYISDAGESMKLILDSYSALIKSQRSILELAGEGSDEATVAMMSDYISEQEKTVWMLVAYLS
ncbi:MAG: DNA starvation/stationary phase protection protein [Bacteroidales bacterium 36-12]|jgi:starvation-inducible DNA-binding protein|nr:MAG: DNA starvation/stationary phase protection protein [Bacteroidales bacterium 36-12]